MSTLSTADRFLGSLVGTYLGHSYVNHVNRQGQYPQTRDSLLYQSWLQDIQQAPPPGPTASNFSPAIALPWFLYHHDDRRARHGWIADTFVAAASTEASHTIGMMYCLGDSLEWLMQCPRTIQHPLPLLCKHLQRQLPTYPPEIGVQMKQLLEGLAPQAAAQAVPQSAVSSASLVMPPLHGTSPPQTDIPMATMALAIKQCLNYRENLALALTSQPGQQPQPTPTIIGSLMGAWGGTAVIPTPWMMSLSSDSRQNLRHMVQRLYRHWAGISSMGDTGETLPLDL